MMTKTKISPFKSNGDYHEDGSGHGHHLAGVEEIGEEHDVEVGGHLEACSEN